ncbi:hypothetical protein GYH30_032622 [Glycine max]|nr:hypothetical protein GYH30_032622 [Glycine max]
MLLVTKCVAVCSAYAILGPTIYVLGGCINDVPSPLPPPSTSSSWITASTAGSLAPPFASPASSPPPVSSTTRSTSPMAAPPTPGPAPPIGWRSCTPLRDSERGWRVRRKSGRSGCTPA